MPTTISIEYECTRQTFRSWPSTAVRWLDWDQDYALAQRMWPPASALTPEAWQEARREGYRYCATIEGQEIQAMAAFWKYCDTAWEAAAVGTRPATRTRHARGASVRRRGFGKAVVSFVTNTILEAGRLGTCSTSGDNIAMQRTAAAVGFYVVRRGVVTAAGD